MARLVRTGQIPSIPRKNFLAGAAATLTAAGCGGGTFSPSGGSSTGGRMEIEIIWPERQEGTRVIPLAAQSMVFKIYPQEEPWTGKILTGTANRPSSGKSIIQLNQLPECKVKVEVFAHPGADGAGVPLGVATQMVTMTPTTPKVTVNFKMSSTVASIEIQDKLGEIEVIQSLTKTIVPSAFNAAGELLLLFPPPQNWKFIIGNTSYATVDSSGKITGLKNGTTTLTIHAVEPNGSGNPVVVKQRVYTLKVISSRVAILGKPKPNADGSQDPPGLYWQSLDSDARQLLVRTTGDHYAVHINPEQTKILFIAKVVHADRTDAQPHAYVVNFDGSGITHVLKQADSWPKFGTACYMKAGYIAAVGSADGTNATSGIYLAKDDDSEFRLLHRMDNVQWITPTPQGEDALVFGTWTWNHSKYLDKPLNLTYSGFWWVDDVAINGPAGRSVYVDLVDGEFDWSVTDDRFMYDPILLDYRYGKTHLVALREPIRQDTMPGEGKWSRRAFWEYYHTKSLFYHEVFCETSEVRQTRLSPRFSVARSGRHVALMDMQSTNRGMPNPDTLYVWNVISRSATPTIAADNWSTIQVFALANPM